MVLEPDATVRLWNPAAERIFGWTAEEAIGRPMPLIPPERAEFRANLEVSLAGGLFEAEVQRRRKDGSPVDLNVSSAPLHDGAGRLRGVVTIVADVSQRKREEAERERLRALLVDAERRRQEEAERERREANVLAGLAREVTASLDVDTVLHRVAEAAKELCAGDAALIAIGAGAASRRDAVGGHEAGAVSGRSEADRADQKRRARGGHAGRRAPGDRGLCWATSCGTRWAASRTRCWSSSGSARRRAGEPTAGDREPPDASPLASRQSPPV